jgi:hypothetical protein
LNNQPVLSSPASAPVKKIIRLKDQVHHSLDTLMAQRQAGKSETQPKRYARLRTNRIFESSAGEVQNCANWIRPGISQLCRLAARLQHQTLPMSGQSQNGS